MNHRVMDNKAAAYDFVQAKQEWRQFCETEPSVTLYQQPWYWDATCDSPDDWRVILVKKDGEIEAAFPFVYVRRKFMWFIETPWQVPSSGIWMRKRREEFRSIESDLMYLKRIVDEVVGCLPYFDRFGVGFNSRLWSWQPFYWHGFEAKAHCNMIICNKPVQEFQVQLSHPRKKRINKARQIYHIETDQVSLDQYWAFFQKSYRDRGRKISYPKEKFEKLFSALMAHNAAKTWRCIFEGETVAESIILEDNERMYHQFGTQMKNDDKYANSISIYETICEAMQKGKIFDFEGSMIQGVAIFNLSFNPQYETLYVISKESAKYKIVNGIRQTISALRDYALNSK